jgi:hypothetical protein
LEETVTVLSELNKCLLLLSKIERGIGENGIDYGVLDERAVLAKDVPVPIAFNAKLTLTPAESFPLP